MPDQPQSSPSRRNVVRGAAWSVPVIALAQAAPAFAASTCPPVTLSYAGTTKYTSGTVGSTTVTISSTGDTNAANNQIPTTASNGAQSNSLRFALDSSTTVEVSQTVTVTFSPAVTGLTFSYLDIDSASSTSTPPALGWFDRVTTTLSGNATVVDATKVVGNGVSTATAFRPANNNTNVPGTSAAGNVNVSVAANVTVSTFSFTYSQPVVGLANTAIIGLSNLTFRPATC